MKLYFPLSDLCPHCQQPLQDGDMSEVKICINSNPTSFMDSWDDVNFQARYDNKKLRRAVFVLKNILIYYWFDSIYFSAECWIKQRSINNDGKYLYNSKEYLDLGLFTNFSDVPERINKLLPLL